VAHDLHGAQGRSCAFQVQEDLRIGIVTGNAVRRHQSQRRLADPTHPGESVNVLARDHCPLSLLEVCNKLLHQFVAPGKVWGWGRQLM
jgi:hypothetical protein